MEQGKSSVTFDMFLHVFSFTLNIQNLTLPLKIWIPLKNDYNSSKSMTNRYLKLNRDYVNYKLYASNKFIWTILP